MSPSTKLLSPNEIARIAPYALIDHVVHGVWKKEGIFIGVMFNVDEKDLELSKGTGKRYIVNSETRVSYCKLLRHHPDKAINTRCIECNLQYFDDVKRKAASNPKYKGQTSFCTSGCTYRRAL